MCYATFTGKAAEVLRKKGNNNCCTLHRLLYDHVPRQGGGFYRKKKTTLDCDIVVVDEISMVPKEMVDLLFTHKVYVICLGDPFQIPPINPEEDNHLLDNPHVFLDEIMRQAEESEIIRLSMEIREGKILAPYRGEEVQIYQKKDLVDGMLTWADQVLVAKNITRIAFNNQIRNMLGKGPMPEAGDKIVCLRNYWDDLSSEGNALVNGTIGQIENPEENEIIFPPFARTEKKSVEALKINLLTDEGDIYTSINIDKNMLLTGETSLDWRDSYKLGKLKPRIGDIVPKQAAYGYAITTHKAQGSEWDKVLVIEENFPFDKVEHARWLYTACTRASEKLVVVMQ